MADLITKRSVRFSVRLMALTSPDWIHMMRFRVWLNENLQDPEEGVDSFSLLFSLLPGGGRRWVNNVLSPERSKVKCDFFSIRTVECC